MTEIKAGQHAFIWENDGLLYWRIHYSDAIMGAVASKITSLTSVYLIVHLGADQRKHQSSASLAQKTPHYSARFQTIKATNLQLDSILNAGLRLALGEFCTSPVSSMYMEANEAPGEERWLKLSMNYYLKTRARTDNPAHHALHEFDPTTKDLYFSKPKETPHNQDQWHTPASWGINKIPWVEVGFGPLLQEAHQCTKDSVQGGSQSHLSGCTLEVGRGQRHTTDAVPDHCLLQARLWMYCVWHSIPYQFTTTWQHPQRCTKTGTWSILHQPSRQYVHRGQRSSSGGTSVETVHELLSENSCLHWQPSTSCPTWIWPDHKRSVSF